MKFHASCASIAFIIAVSLPCAAAAAPLSVIPYAGSLYSSGTPADGSYEMIFRLYDSATGATNTALWTEGYCNDDTPVDGYCDIAPEQVPKSGDPIMVVNGQFSVVLGGTAPDGLPAVVWKASALYLEVEVDGTILQGRQRLGTVPTPLSDVMQGTYPVVVGAEYSCGAPASLDLIIDNTPAITGSAAFGALWMTNGGMVRHYFGYPSWTGCSNFCSPPMTYFLKSPTAQDIQIDAYLDNGPSVFYINGTAAVTDTANARATETISVPAGAFALSIVTCSSDGASAAMVIYNPFITDYGLSVDFDRTFHRNGM